MFTPLLTEKQNNNKKQKRFFKKTVVTKNETKRFKKSIYFKLFI